MITIDELQKCKTYLDGLRLIGINYITKSSKEKLFNVCKSLNFDFESHVKIQKEANIKICKYCGQKLKKGQKSFCSRSCSAKYYN